MENEFAENVKREIVEVNKLYRVRVYYFFTMFCTIEKDFREI